MTKIIELAGFGVSGRHFDAVEAKQRGAAVRRPEVIPTDIMSEGEMLVELYRQRFKMLSEYYPEVTGYKRGEEIARDALYKGLHTATGVVPVGSFFDPDLQGLGAVLVKARGMTNPASRWTSWENKSRTPATSTVSEIPQIDCENLNPSNFNPPSMQEWLQGGGFGSGLPLNSQGYNEWVTEQLSQQTQAFNNCTHENRWREILNDKWMDVAHHPLYEFVDAPNLKPSTVATKAVLHSNAIGTISNLSKIGRTLIRTWQENGIIYHNMKEGAGPLKGAESVEAVKQAYEDGISALPAAVLIAVLGAITAALVASTDLINAIKGNSPTDAQQFEINTNGWGTPNWTSKPEDWATGGQQPNQPVPGNQSDIQRNLPLILLGAGGLILLK